MSNALRDQITNRLVEMIEAGVKKTGALWAGQNLSTPRSFITKKRYKGINTLSLWCEAKDKGFKSNFWLTYKQAESLGGKVRKGEKAVTCVYYSKIDKTKKSDVTGEDVDASFMLMKPFWLFNLDQIDGIDVPNQVTGIGEFTPVEAAEKLIQATGAVINYGGNEAFYRPSTDEITLPNKEDFTSVNNYYATALHELGHWSGHKSRMQRDLSGSFGSDSYAFEELVADFSSVMIMGELDLHEATMEHHADYLQSWLKVLKNDKTALFKAASQAQKAADFILQFSDVVESEDEDKEYARKVA